jgi:RNA polymerase sigma-70 factor (ECF subfamily)
VDVGTDATSAERPAAVALTVDELYDRHVGAVHRYLARRLGRVRAEDATAETFRIAFERLATFDSARGAPLPWLLGIATNVVRRAARDEERWLRALGRLGSQDGSAVDAPDGVATSVDLGAALAALAPGDRDVVLLVLWEDLTYDQAAAALDIAVGTVRSRLHRARKQLRPMLEGHDD